MSEGFLLFSEDAVSFSQGLPDESIDLIVTDPAYESLEDHRAVGTTTRLQGTWMQIFPNDRYPELFKEFYRILKPNTHCYVMCDQKTMFVIKPIAEEAGFKFWKPIVWDKCLAPDTLVWTARGVIEIGDIQAGDVVSTPTGRDTVLGTRRTKSPTVRMKLSDGTNLTISPDHLMVREDGVEVPASSLSAGDFLKTSEIALSCRGEISEIVTEDLIPEDKLVYQLPETNLCLWCNAEFSSSRAASAHQARFCKKAKSKKDMAKELGVSAKKLSWWLNRRAIPAPWADILGMSGVVTGRCRATHQNDAMRTFPETVPIDYSLGRFVGLYAAQGFRCTAGIGFAFNAAKRDSHAFIARYVRNFGLTAKYEKTSEGGCSVLIYHNFATWLIQFFIEGSIAPDKYFLPSVYAASSEFRAGVFDGLLDGDGHFEFKAYRDKFVSTSPDLTSFVLRQARLQGWPAKVRRGENNSLGYWAVTFDRSQRCDGLCIEDISPGPCLELVDIAISEPHQFLLANGAVTHNCSIGMGYHYRARYEFILFFEKGKRKLKDLGMPDILTHKKISNGYPTEKPEGLFENLILQSSDEGDLVYDPFLGSGSSGVASVWNRRQFLGTDISEQALVMAQNRIEKARRK